MFKKYSIELQWGLIFSLMMLVWMVLERWFGLHDTHIDLHPYLTNLVMIPAITIYVLALLDKKQSYFGGNMTYKHGFISGIIVTLVVTLLSPLTQYITIKFITPSYFANAINYSVSHGLTTLEKAQEFFNMRSYIIQTVIFTPVAGVITTAIVAIFTRTRHK
jgi:hypothetical protein